MKRPSMGTPRAALLGATVACSAAVVCAVLWSAQDDDRDGAPQARRAAAAPKNEGMERSVAERRRPLFAAALESRVRALEERASGGAASSPGVQPAAHDEEPTLPKDPDTLTRERVARIDSAFESESLDRDWAWDAKQDISAAFESGGYAGSSLERLDCRATFCRLEARHDSQSGRADFEEIAYDVRMGSVGIPVELPDGIGTVVYFVRKQYDTPEHPARRTDKSVVR